MNQTVIAVKLNRLPRLVLTISVDTVGLDRRRVAALDGELMGKPAPACCTSLQRQVLGVYP